MSSANRRGLPEFRKMRHDRHFVEELANQSVTAIGVMLPIESIEANREQPRSNLGDLAELAASIRARGILEPLLVRPIEGSKKYQLIAGERRFRAAIEAGLTEVPCLEMPLSDEQALEVALVENLQRKDLSPFEEGDGYRTLIEKYSYTHEQVASAVGKSRPTISESLRLLAIPPAIRDLCRHADITAKSMLLLIARAHSIEEMERLVQEIAEGGLDRASARLSAAQPERESNAIDPKGDVPEQSGRFRPIQIRHQTDARSPVRFALSIRRPGVTREEVVAMLESFLDRLRAGELDGALQGQAQAPNPRKP